MSFDDKELFGELANKIGAEDLTDPGLLLERGDKEKANSNNATAQSFFEKALAASTAKAARLEESSQYRSAAEMNFIGAEANLRLGKTEEAMGLYNKVGEQLLIAGKNYIDMYNEYFDGVLCVTLGSLVNILQGKIDEAKSVYLEYIKKLDEAGESGKLQQGGETLKQTIWSVGYILKALQDTDHEALQNAQQLISTNIKPNLIKAKLSKIAPLLDQVVSYTLNYFQSQIKLPKITHSLTLPNEMLLNQIFDIKMTIGNTGEGDASNLHVTFNLPEDFEILGGKKEISISQVPKNTQEEINLKLRILSSDSEDKVIPFNGKITYQDMLQNDLVSFIGPLDLEIRANSQKDELQKKFTEIKGAIESLFLEVKDQKYPNSFIQNLTNKMNKIFETTESELRVEHFETVKANLSQLTNEKEWLQELFRGNSGKMIQEELKSSKEKYANERVSSRESELQSQFDKTKEELIYTKEKEKDAALLSLRNEIEEKNKKLVEGKEKEFEERLKAEEKKYEIKLKQVVNETKERQALEHQQKIEVINNKNEVGIRQIQEEYQNDLKTKVEEIKKQEDIKLEEELRKLKSEHYEELRKLEASLQEEKESEIQNMKAQHANEIDALKNQYSSQHSSDLQEKISFAKDETKAELTRQFQLKEEEYKKEIEGLKHRIAQLESNF